MSKKKPSLNYKKLYEREADKSNTFYDLAESRKNYANQLEKEVIDLIKCNADLECKNKELIRLNHLLQDTISSFKTPFYKKVWASIKYQVKAWIKKYK